MCNSLKEDFKLEFISSSRRDWEICNSNYVAFWQLFFTILATYEIINILRNSYYSFFSKTKLSLTLDHQEKIILVARKKMERRVNRGRVEWLSPMLWVTHLDINKTRLQIHLTFWSIRNKWQHEIVYCSTLDQNRIMSLLEK